MIQSNTGKTLRLLFPQWQGGNNLPYVFGARLLNWLAPSAEGPFEEVPVSLSTNKEIEQGIFARGTLLKQARDARDIVAKHNPERVVVFGGDCGVELAPFAYLIDKYDGDVAILWVDAHPDVLQPEYYENHHAHVLANLLGVGDAEFVAEVPRKVDPNRVLYVGLNDGFGALQLDPIKQFNLAVAGPEEIEKDSGSVLDWLDKKKPAKVIIHFDLDVLDLRHFRSLLVADPETYAKKIQQLPKGVGMETITRLLQDVAKAYDVVGLGITEHFPWDSYFLANMLYRLPLIGDIHNSERLPYRIFEWVPGT